MLSVKIVNLEISFSIIGEVIKYYLFNSLVTNDRFLPYRQERDNNSFHANRKVPVDWLDIATAMYIHKSQTCLKPSLLQAHFS